MAEMSSFYGGRYGASFVIVERFPAISITETTYKKTYYARNAEGIILYPFVERVDDNWQYQYNQTVVELNGETKEVWNTNTNQLEIVALPKETLEGMVQCFQKGGETTSRVNYGEYVIIDTVSKDDPDNGKVYRRGMNYDSELGGAEYIGQIVGPKGSTADVEIGTFKEVSEAEGAQKRSYKPDDGNPGLVPGIEKDGTINDKIEYAQVTFRDEFKNVINYKVGFKFPYLVPEISGGWRSSYYTQEDFDLGRITDESLIGTPIKLEDGFDLFIDNGESSEDRDPNHGDTGHPFYRKWKISIPKGIKGDTIKELKIFPTVAIEGATYYAEAAVDGTLSEPEGTLDASAAIVVDSYWDTFDKGYVTIEVNNISYYCYLTDTAELHYGYLFTQYDEHEDGSDHKWIDIGAYRVIDRTEMTDEGEITVYYTEGAEDTFAEALSWLHDTEIDRKGHVTIGWNNNARYDASNPYSYGASGWTSTDGKAAWETDITWPTQVNLTNEGVLKFLFNNNLINDIYPSTETYDGIVDYNEGSYKFILPWLEKVKLFSNGTFNFVFNNSRIYDNSDKVDWKDHLTYAPRITWPTGIDLSNKGVFKVFFNNDLIKNEIISRGGTWVAADNAWQAIISYVTEVSLNDSGLFVFTYNTGNTRGKQVSQIKTVEVAEDGTITFIYCDDTSDKPHRYNAPYKIKYLTGVSINTGDIEGTGNQKVHIKYNTGDAEDIGNPLNYVIESCISIPNASYPSVPYQHLLVYYSDPDLRASLSDKWVTYPSVKYPGVERTEWVDLGSVKGENSGIHILKNVDSMDDLKDADGNQIPPEQIVTSSGAILRGGAAGWSCTLQDPDTDLTIYLFYDYEAKKWYKGTTVDPSAVDPSYIIAKSTPLANQEPDPEDVSNLRDHGFWFAIEKTVAIK